MSLINQALKKAQHDRKANAQFVSSHDERSNESPTTPRQKNSPRKGLIGLITSCILLVGLLGGLLLPQLMHPPSSTIDQAAPLNHADKRIEPVEATATDLKIPERPAETIETTTPQKTIERNAAIIEWLSNARMSGLRLDDNNESRVLLNNHSYRVGETVNQTLGLKVLIILEKRVLFIDSNGQKYLKKL